MRYGLTLPRDILIWLLVAISPGPLLAAKSEPIDWWAIDKAVLQELATENLVSLAKSLGDKERPQDATELLRRFDIFIRAGHRPQAAVILEDLRECSSQLQKDQLSPVLRFLIQREEWDLSRHFMECFPEVEHGWIYSLIENWAQADADPKEIDKWLADRTAANPSFWIKERVRFRARIGTEGELVEELASDVRAEPTSISKAILYIEATSNIGRPTDLNWLGDTCRPKLALDSYRLAGELMSRQANRGAVVLLQRSLHTPILAEDLAKVEPSQSPRSEEQIKTDLRRWTKTSLIRCYQKLGETKKAQQLIEELVEEGGKDGPPDPWLARMAGEIQGESGQRVIENTLREKEIEQVDSPKYWLARANYYVGRKEHGEAIKAFEKALELAPVAPPRRGKAPADIRNTVLRTYWRFLAKNGHGKDAVQLLRRELELVAPDMSTASVAVSGLLDLDRDFDQPLDPDDPLIWSLLEKSKKWDYPVGRLLGRILQGVPTGMGSPFVRGVALGSVRATSKKLQPYCTRAEKLAVGADPSRAAALGSIMSRMGDPVRALPLLQDAIERLPEGSDRQSATFNLFEVYLDIGDHKAAEQIFPTARLLLTSGEIPDWLGRIALAAAQSGATADAMRLWRRRSNLDLANLQGLEQLARAGMKESLRGFYQEIKEKDPDSWVPDRALELLN